MAAGRPVVASDTSWIREILSDEEGVVTDELEEGVRKLEDYTERYEKADNARDKTLDELSWRNTVEKIRRLYKQLLTSKQ